MCSYKVAVCAPQLVNGYLIIGCSMHCVLTNLCMFGIPQKDKESAFNFVVYWLPFLCILLLLMYVCDSPV